VASTETKTVGTLLTFLGAFEKQGGEFRMLSWLADDPEMMKEAVLAADKRLLEFKHARTFKFTEPLLYNPAECFSPGEHQGVRIASVEGRSIGADEQRSTWGASFAAYDLRRNAPLGDICREQTRLKLKAKMEIDDLWAALIDHKGNPDKTFLAVDGQWNMFNLLLSGNWYWPVMIRLGEEGWHLYAPSSLSPQAPNGIPKGTRFIMNG
jgi:hypothetical protein